MKSTALFFFMAVFNFMVVFNAIAAGSLQAQVSSASDSTGLPGDNFSLGGALEMFKNAGSPEEFEERINTEDNHVNNLDLNSDGNSDYINVVEKKEGNAHAFILRAVVSESESQDIAVIELEKTADGEAVLQIVGDEDIFGEQIIIEPTVKEIQAKPTASANVAVNVWSWPLVRHVYVPSYRVWASPWGWRVRPAWWRPWKPVHYHVFYPYRARYHNRYVVAHHHRVVHAHRVYAPVRITSVTVQTRNQASVNRYRASRSAKTVTVQQENRQVKATRKTTTVQGKQGKAAKTTTRVRKRS